MPLLLLLDDDGVPAAPAHVRMVRVAAVLGGTVVALLSPFGEVAVLGATFARLLAAGCSAGVLGETLEEAA